MKIQQHDGMVVDAAGCRQGFAKCKRGGEVLRREREATKGFRYDCSSFSPLYIGPRERGRAQPCPLLQGRVRLRVGRSPSSPRHLGGAFPL